MFQYKSNDTNFTQYNQVLVALFIRSKFALECVCALFLETEAVFFLNLWGPIFYFCPGAPKNIEPALDGLCRGILYFILSNI
jgi:hypothetical protein